MKLLTALCLFIVLAWNENQVQAASCSCNCDDGGSKTCPGYSANTNVIPKRLVKQCVFSNLNDDRDSGPLDATCKFTKAESHTALRVTFNGNMRVIGCSGGCCRRFFLTINGKECKDPATIDTQIYATGSVNRHSPKTLDGFCYNIPQGKVTVGLSITTCSGVTPGNAFTGWYSVSRFIIEEMTTL